MNGSIEGDQHGALGHDGAILEIDGGDAPRGFRPHDHRFAELRRQGGNTYVDRVAAHLDVEAAILWQALFRNVEPGHQLEA